METEKHAIVESYWVEELPNGVIHLLFNCNSSYYFYHQLSDFEYVITNDEDGVYDIKDKDIIKIPFDFLKYDKETINVYMYVTASIQEKDQLSYYFIPYQKEWIQNRRVIFKSATNESYE